MSASPQKADIKRTSFHFAFVPLGDERRCSKLIFDLLLRCRSDVFQRDTAVDQQFDPGDVAAFITCKIDRRPGDIPGVAAEMVDWARSAGFSVIAAGKGTKYLPAYHTVTPDGVWEYYGITPPECHFRTPCFFDLLPAEL